MWHSPSFRKRLRGETWCEILCLAHPSTSQVVRLAHAADRWCHAGDDIDGPAPRWALSRVRGINPRAGCAATAYASECSTAPSSRCPPRATSRGSSPSACTASVARWRRTRRRRSSGRTSSARRGASRRRCNGTAVRCGLRELRRAHPRRSTSEVAVQFRGISMRRRCHPGCAASGWNPAGV